MLSLRHKHTKSLLISTRRQHATLLVTLVFLTVAHSILAKEEKRPILGVQRWDMYSGKGATQKQELGYLPGKQGFLKPAEWHSRAPFFCRLTKDVDFVKHPPNAGPLWFNHPFDKKILQNAMDQEIRFAHQAGIDFFVYHGPARNLVANGWGLKNNLDAQKKSKIPEAKKMKFIWALYGHKSMNYSRSKVSLMMDEAIEYIKLPNWQTVMNGRPLLVIMWPDNFKAQLESKAGNEHMTGSDFLKYVRKRVIDAGLKNPYIVGMAVPARSHLRAEDWKTEGYDAFSDYAGGYGGTTAKRDQAPTYAQATEKLKKTWKQQFTGQALPSIPPCTSMQYPWPRAIDHKTNKPATKWYHYQWPKKGDLTNRVKAALDFAAAHPQDCEAQAVIMYSWNEHSEGGGLCPTMGDPPNYKPNTQWLDEVAKALAEWKPKP